MHGKAHKLKQTKKSISYTWVNPMAFPFDNEIVLEHHPVPLWRLCKRQKSKPHCIASNKSEANRLQLLRSQATLTLPSFCGLCLCFTLEEKKGSEIKPSCDVMFNVCHSLNVAYMLQPYDCVWLPKHSYLRGTTKKTRTSLNEKL